MLKHISFEIKKQKTHYRKNNNRSFVKKKQEKKKTQRGFTQIPNDIIDDFSLTCQEKAVILAIYRHNYNNGHAYPGIKLISKEAGCSKSTTIRKLKNLRKKGYISWTKTKKQNIYALPFSIK
jgi:DNA-binding MarR family transcriptional regulator